MASGRRGNDRANGKRQQSALEGKPTGERAVAIDTGPEDDKQLNLKLISDIAHILVFKL